MGAMGLLVGMFFFMAVWLTFLTMRQRRHKRITDDLDKKSRFYLKELKRISNQEDERRERERSGEGQTEA